MRKQVEESNDFDSDGIKRRGRKKADDSKDNANAANFAKKGIGR